MKVLVVSDTHGIVKPFIKELEKHKDAEMIFHLGDMVHDALKIKENTDIPMVIVRGNNDYFSENTPWSQIVRIKGHKILLTHGHMEKINYGITSLYFKAKESEADLVFYGHTHVYSDEYIDGIRLINPGSAGYDRARQYESYVVMNIEEDSIEIERVKLTN